MSTVKTHAAVLYAPHTPLRVEEVDLGPVKDEDVLVRIVASGVCHSDLHVYHGQPGRQFPVVLGHEGAGIVEQVGGAVTTVRPGDHVVLNLAPFCGRCYDCATGKTYRCTVRKGQNGLLYDGATRLSRDGQRIYHFTNVAAFARHAIVHHSSAVPIAKDIPFEVACLVGCCVCTGVGAALNTAQVRPGSTVVVIGCGGVGLNVIQGARLAGAKRIIAVDVLDEKLARARRFGATDAIDASKEKTVARVMELTAGRGAGYAFEAIGKPQTMMDAYTATGRGGKAVVVGISPDATARLSINPASLLAERSLTGTQTGSTNATRDFPLYLDLYRSGRLMIDELITARVPLEQVNEAFAALEQGRAVRTVLMM
ncbi:MAG: Zn-dependent alcohol dehydrogenase [Chloroflexi bacterium]|nr:Zn-dependent alcohol dehydrogenase [Chloroflexota bacterium]